MTPIDADRAFVRECIVALEVLHASDAAGPKGKPRGRLSGVSALLGAGVHVVLGAPEDGTLALSAVLAGARKPTRGRVIVAGCDIRKLGSARARVGVLDLDPRLPPAATVGSSVRAAMRARGEEGRAIDAILDPLGLSRLHARQLRGLSWAEARAVELALAVSTPAPILVTLHEPFSDVAIPDVGVLREKLRELAAAGACVVITTASSADARAVADRVYVLRAGVVALDVAPSQMPEGGVFGEVVAWISARDAGAKAVELRAKLAASSDVLGISSETEDGLPPDGHDAGAPTVLRIRARSAEVAARVLIDASLDADVALDGFAPVSPTLPAMRAAADAALRARFTAARAANALARPVLPPAAVTAPMPPPPPPPPVEVVAAHSPEDPR